MMLPKILSALIALTAVDAAAAERAAERAAWRVLATDRTTVIVEQSIGGGAVSLVRYACLTGSKQSVTIEQGKPVYGVTEAPTHAERYVLSAACTAAGKSPNV